ncbi:hypothetical protein C5167_046407 [Papaver somniferum]|uniref:Uncharacterized protein n=1 Tax=Papaver somniferum TaxID=3469 RepID=A0A4Y7LG58_PAPSO|nr:hypothetical protein C5167_046407 [Papaver somniferum]
MLNIKVFRDEGVPQSSVVKFLINQPMTLSISIVKWKDIVQERKWGWSEDAIAMHPQCMRRSEKKIMSVMDFLVQQMDEDYTQVFRLPNFSLKRSAQELNCLIFTYLYDRGVFSGEVCDQVRARSPCTIEEVTYL